VHYAGGRRYWPPGAYLRSGWRTRRRRWTVWDGGGRNPNAALTVFRHYDSATVLQGLIGEQPQTVMLMGYPLFGASLPAGGRLRRPR
jgi:hypothetical protein